MLFCRVGGGGGVGTRGWERERANALLMGFIQAWKLQVRPPHGRVGVNFLSLVSPVSPLGLGCSPGFTLMQPHTQTGL